MRSGLPGKNTFRYTKTGTVIEEDTWFQDGDVRLHLFPIPSSHAKGSLALEVDETWCFLGDAAYATQKTDRPFIMPSACWQKSEF